MSHNETNHKDCIKRLTSKLLYDKSVCTSKMEVSAAMIGTIGLLAWALYITTIGTYYKIAYMMPLLSIVLFLMVVIIKNLFKLLHMKQEIREHKMILKVGDIHG